MEFGKRRDTTDTEDFCPHQLVTDLLQTSLVVYVADLLWTCNGETGVMDFGFQAEKASGWIGGWMDKAGELTGTACDTTGVVGPNPQISVGSYRPQSIQSANLDYRDCKPEVI